MNTKGWQTAANKKIKPASITSKLQQQLQSMNKKRVHKQLTVIKESRKKNFIINTSSVNNNDLPTTNNREEQTSKDGQQMTINKRR